MIAIITRAQFEASALNFMETHFDKSIVFNKRYGAQCIQVFKGKEKADGAKIGRAGNAYQLPESINHKDYSPNWDWSNRYTDNRTVKWGDDIPVGSWIIWGKYPGNSTGHIAMFVKWLPDGAVRVFDQWRQDNEFDENGIVIKLGKCKHSDFVFADNLKTVLTPKLVDWPKPVFSAPVIKETVVPDIVPKSKLTKRQAMKKVEPKARKAAAIETGAVVAPILGFLGINGEVLEDVHQAEDIVASSASNSNEPNFVLMAIVGIGIIYFAIKFIRKRYEGNKLLDSDGVIFRIINAVRNKREV